jgi:hypothetical protein
MGAVSDQNYLDQYFDRANCEKPTTAYHEAGHLVAAYLKLGSVGDADVVADVVRVGRAWVGFLTAVDLWQAHQDGPEVSDELRGRIERQVVVLLAGRAAEVRARHEGLVSPKVVPDVEPERAEWDQIFEDIAREHARRDAGLAPSRSDEEHARDLLARISADAGEALVYEHLLGLRSAKLVEGELAWGLIQALAAALLDSEVLAGADIEQTIRRAMEGLEGAQKEDER